MYFIREKDKGVCIILNLESFSNKITKYIFKKCQLKKLFVFVSQGRTLIIITNNNQKKKKI